jgi:uncharacterized membrane protein
MASSYNPYQPPTFDQVPATPPGDFDIGRSIREGFENTKRHAAVAIGVFVLAGLCMGLSAITIIGYFVLIPVLGWGLVKFLLALHDGNPQVSDLFSGFSNYGTVLGRTLLAAIILGAIGVASESLVFVGQYMKSLPIQALGWVVYAAAIALVLGRLYFAFFFIVDKDMPAVQALSAAWQATQGKGLKIFALMIISGLLGALGMLALCIGVLFTLPMSYAIYASAYRQMVGGPVPHNAGGPLPYGGPPVQYGG